LRVVEAGPSRASCLREFAGGVLVDRGEVLIKLEKLGGELYDRDVCDVARYALSAPGGGLEFVVAGLRPAERREELKVGPESCRGRR
jgi:hypothetical protein